MSGDLPSLLNLFMNRCFSAVRVKSGSAVGQLIFEALEQSKPQDGYQAEKKMLAKNTFVDIEIDPVISSRI